MNETIERLVSRLKGVEVDSEEVKQRKLVQLAFITTFKLNPSGPVVLEKILDLLHWFDPAVDPADMALQNAAKGILHLLGVWGNVQEDRTKIVQKMLAD